MTPEEQTEREVRGHLVQLGHIPLERRIRVLNDTWQALVTPELRDLPQVVALEVIRRATETPGQVPECEVIDLDRGTGTWAVGQKAN